MMTTNRYKKAIYLVVTVLLLNLLIGCSANKNSDSKSTGTSDNGATESGKVQELNIWMSDWGAEFNKIFDDSVAKYFTPNHPNIKLKISHMKVEEKLLPAVASGNVPDLTYLNSSLAIPFALNGALEPLDEFMKVNNFDPVEDFSANINASFTWDGNLYGVGLAADSLAIYWNKAAFKEAGLDPDKGPTTLEEISEYNSKLLKKDDSGKLQQIGLNISGSVYPFFTVGVATGSKWYDTENKKSLVNEESMISAYEYILKETDAIGIDELTKFAGGFGTGNNDPFYSGKTAMVVDGFWKVMDAKQVAPDMDYGVVSFPKAYAGLSWGFGIPSGAKNKEGAEEFLKWLLTDKSAGKFMAEGTNPFNYKPGLEEWFTAFDDISKGTPNEKYMDVWKEIMENSQENTYTSPAPAAYDQWLAQAMNDVIHHSKTPKAALDEANKQIQSEIDKALSAAKK